jgi:DNA-binding LacI/PurR family transcriptional regulator
MFAIAIVTDYSRCLPEAIACSAPRPYFLPCPPPYSKKRLFLLSTFPTLVPTRIFVNRMNIQEVAKRAGVSTATVSRTINGSNKVTPKTAERVRRAIALLNYYPNTNARALGSGRSRLLGLIISDITNPFFPELVKSFEDIAVKHGLDVIVSNTSYSPERTELCVQRMLERKVDGVAVMTSEMGEHLIERLQSRQIPMVFLDTGRLDSGEPAGSISNIVIEYGAGIDEAVAHLVALGHSKIGFISGPPDLASARTRREAFLKSLKRKRLSTSRGLIETGNHRIDGGRMAMERLLEAKNRPTAVLASNDLTAIGAIGAIHQHGLRVPEDISVVGFDDIEMSAFVYPPLTTVRLSRAAIADRAFHALYTAEGRSALTPAEYTIRPELIVRGSTAPPPRKAGK